ncbi:hypothetical protein AYI68_g3374 [Smittium mucronatum]|uniref:Uncharacterized protein n=1 Tax=Smittium mucronatum TaxID=133383 RepID=A0A1R0H032_9FUNG|nr:hypothetical protein AYI68_g3374 [Smittium mucronatum]
MNCYSIKPSTNKKENTNETNPQSNKKTSKSSTNASDYITLDSSGKKAYFDTDSGLLLSKINIINAANYILNYQDDSHVKPEHN